MEQTRRRFGLAAAIVAAVTVGGAVAWWPAQPESRLVPGSPAASRTAETPTVGGSAGPIVLDEVPVLPPAEGFPIGDPGDPGGPGDQGDPAPGAQDEPQGIGQPDDPCAGADGWLVVSPDPLTLPAGATSGSVTVRNCGAEPAGWTAQSKPWVTLAGQSGTLASAASHELGFTADAEALAANGNTFRIKVSQPGHNVYVEVSATGAEGGQDEQEPQQPQQEQDQGCAASCITKAWLTPRHGTPDLDLEVRTDTAAKVRVEVGTTAPQHDEQGRPYLPDPELSASTDLSYRTRWDTTLTPLEPGTKYHIVVVAVDKQGHRSTEVGRFTTTRPATGLSAGLLLGRGGWEMGTYECTG